jgi:hypothetical protein
VSARELLVRASNTVGFPAPARAQGLIEWADESLDTTLARGSQPWADAHAHVLDALEAAMLGSESGVRAALELARDRACAQGRRPCTCPSEARGHRVELGELRVCVKCGGRD